jgi:hypothetical protein
MASAVVAISAGSAAAAEKPNGKTPIAQVRILNGPVGMSPQAGWLGTCYPAVGSNWGGGWCDGNGPNWNYQGWVDCTNGGEYFGVIHWAGDRRGSYAYCPSGTWATAGGVDAFYLS